MSLFIIFFIVSACSTVEPKNGVMTEQEIRQIEKCYGKNVRTTEKALGLTIDAEDISEKGTSTAKADVARTICTQAFSPVVDFYDNGFSSVRYIFQSDNQETVRNTVRELYAECKGIYGEPVSFSGIQERISNHLEDAESSKTYIEYWSIGKKSICSINVIIPDGKGSEGMIAVGYFENTGQIAK